MTTEPEGPQPISDEELAKLREVAEAATPGPWTWGWGEDAVPALTDAGSDSYGVVGLTAQPIAATNSLKHGHADAAFIAAFNPSTATRLLDQLHAAESRANYWQMNCEEQIEVLGERAVAAEVAQGEAESQRDTAYMHAKSVGNALAEEGIRRREVEADKDEWESSARSWEAITIEWDERIREVEAERDRLKSLLRRWCPLKSLAKLEVEVKGRTAIVEAQSITTQDCEWDGYAHSRALVALRQAELKRDTVAALHSVPTSEEGE